MADHCLRRRSPTALVRVTEPRGVPTASPNPQTNPGPSPAPRRRRPLGLGLVAALVLSACAGGTSQPHVAPPKSHVAAVTEPRAPEVVLPADPSGNEPLAAPEVDPAPAEHTAATEHEASGGSGEGEEIKLGSIGTIGHGAGVGAGAGRGIGSGTAGSRRGGSPAPKGGSKGSGSWGSSSGESYGAGGLGLSGVGEGGGGRGDKSFGRPGVRAGTSGVSGRAASGHRAQSRDVKAGEWDDNANYQDYLKYQKLAGPARTKLDVSQRRFLVVHDAKRQPIPNCTLSVAGAQASSAVLTTGASGRAILFPRAHELRGAQVSVTAACLGHKQTKQLSLAASDGVLAFQLPVVRKLPDTRVLDIAFVLDTTGSMSEEIAAMKDTLEKVAKTLKGMRITPRVGLVEYRDKGDVYLTRTHQMTTDVDGFAARVGGLSANGGGDMPEHVNEGLRVALTKLKWSDRSLGRMAFLIGDAPPQLDYTDDTPFTRSVMQASERGIQLFTIAASGMDDLGQSVWRQIAMFTGGTNMFVLRGGAGPQSVGAGDPKDSCGTRHDNYTSGNLAELISSKVQGTMRELTADPLRIAGLGKDENTKPCDQRVAHAANAQ